MISFSKSSLFPGWEETLKNMFVLQGQMLNTQRRISESVFRAMLGLPRAGGNGDNPAVQPRTVNDVTEAAPVAAAVTAESKVDLRTKIKDRVAVVTGAASGIGAAVVRQLAEREARAVILVDRSDATAEVAESINKSFGRPVAHAKIGDTTSEDFRVSVFDEVLAEHGVPSICVPAAGITRDRLSVKVDKNTGKADIYPMGDFRLVTEVNLIAPIFWALEMVARIAEDRHRRGKGRWDPEEGIQGTVVFIGSVSSQGNKGQISYAVSKAGLEGAASTLMKEAIFHGVRCGVIHPGFTDTPMVRAMGADHIAKHVLPYTQLRRLIQPEEIADAICFMITNSAVSGELWADAGWHPTA